MSIQFRCTQCDKLLATPPGSEGQKAKCPECGTILVIPAASTAAGSDGVDHFDAPPARDPDLAASEPPPRQTAAPIQSSHDDASRSPVGPDFNPTRIGFAEVLNKTWRIYTGNLGVLIVASLLYHVCSTAATAAAWAIGAALIDNAGALAVPVVFSALAATAVLNSFFLIGLMTFMLTVARGQRVDFGDLFIAGPLTLPGVGVFALWIVGTVAGGVFCLIPGIIFLLIFSQSLYMLLDRRAGIVESFKDSAAAMKGNLLTFFSLVVVVFIATTLFIIMTCGLGAFFTAPFISLMFAVVYLSVTGQRTAEDGAARYDAERPFDVPGVQPT